MISVSGQSRVEEVYVLVDINWIKDKSAPIAAKYGLRRMYLFGSHAKGIATKDSDIDLLFEKGEKLSLLGVSNMLQDLTESLGCSVDLVSRDSLEKSFNDEVLNTQVLIYEK